jgi:hypothetical protein
MLGARLPMPRPDVIVDGIWSRLGDVLWMTSHPGFVTAASLLTTTLVDDGGCALFGPVYAKGSRNQP